MTQVRFSRSGSSSVSSLGRLLALVAFCCGSVALPGAAAAQPPLWDTPRGQACFERWISEAMSRLNRHSGDERFNACKPYGINQYGIWEGRGGRRFCFISAYAPDDFSRYSFNKYWRMWDTLRYSYTSDPGWPDASWNAAGVPRLREYVEQCAKERSPGDDISGPVVPPPNSGNACGFTLGGGIYDKWISTGGERGFLGCPTGDEREAGSSPQGTSGRYAEFRGGDGGYIIWHGSGRLRGTSFEVHGCIYRIYRTMGTSSWLGFPLSDEYDVAGGRRSDFEGGYIQWDAATRECKAYRPGEGSDKQQFCGEYARTAVSQNDENLRRNCGYGGGRWQSNYDNHFGWCMEASRFSAEWETGARREDLAKCGGGAPPPPPPGQSRYLGCFRDDPNRDLTFDGQMNNSNTRDACIATCRQAGFAYSGVQAGAYCFCGNTFGRYGAASNCDRPCPGNSSETCGGALANDISETGVPAPR